MCHLERKIYQNNEQVQIACTIFLKDKRWSSIMGKCIWHLVQVPCICKNKFPNAIEIKFQCLVLSSIHNTDSKNTYTSPSEVSLGAKDARYKTLSKYVDIPPTFEFG